MTYSKVSNPLNSAKPIRSDPFSGQLQPGGFVLKPAMREKVLVHCLELFKHSHDGCSGRARRFVQTPL